MCFKLHCQQFVEIVRKGETTEALSFAQEVLRPYTEIGDEDTYASALRGVIPLIAYPEPETSPVGSHLSQTCRDKLADDVNSAILCELLGNESSPNMLLLEYSGYQTID